MSDAPPPEQLDAAADGAFSGKLADPADTLTKRGGKGHVVYEGTAYDRLAWTRRCAERGYTLAAGEGALLLAALVEAEQERDRLADKWSGLVDDHGDPLDVADILEYVGILREELSHRTAERDALREEVVRLTDLATLSGEVFAFAITDAKMPNLETRRQLHDAVKRAILDAALAVQPPSTENTQ